MSLKVACPEKFINPFHAHTLSNISGDGNRMGVYVERNYDVILGND